MSEKHENQRKRLLSHLEENQGFKTKNENRSVDDSVAGLNHTADLKELKMPSIMIPLHWLTPQ